MSMPHDAGERGVLEIPEGTDNTPLVVDLDGTLLRSDILLETLLLFWRTHPYRALAPLGWLMRGKAHLKQQLALATDLDCTRLPYDTTVLDFLQSEQARGRPIHLATASHRHVAERVVEHLKLFDRTFATEGSCNLAGAAKRDLLIHTFGAGGFDYLGNSRDDLPVWQAARKAYLANAPPAVVRSARHFGNVDSLLCAASPGLSEWRGAMRLHQWLKNLLKILLTEFNKVSLHLFIKYFLVLE